MSRVPVSPMKRGEQAHGVGAAADAGDGDVGQASLGGTHLLRALVADDPLQVAHEAGERMRPDRGAEHVVARLDVA